MLLVLLPLLRLSAGAQSHLASEVQFMHFIAAVGRQTDNPAYKPMQLEADIIKPHQRPGTASAATSSPSQVEPHAAHAHRHLTIHVRSLLAPDLSSSALFQAAAAAALQALHRTSGRSFHHAALQAATAAGGHLRGAAAAGARHRLLQQVQPDPNVQQVQQAQPEPNVQIIGAFGNSKSQEQLPLQGKPGPGDPTGRERFEGSGIYGKQMQILLDLINRIAASEWQGSERAVCHV